MNEELLQKNRNQQDLDEKRKNKQKLNEIEYENLENEI